MAQTQDVAQNITKAQSPKMVEELQRMQQEPILPVEKKLLGWSIGIGVGMLGFFYWLSVTLFPGGH